MQYIKEQIEKHDTLNPKIWNRDNSLREEVHESILKIVDKFKSSLQIPLNIVDIHIVGSNASYNYTKYSDLDIHLIANFDDYNASKEILQALYDSEKADFNRSFEISIHGISVEIYVEDIHSTTLSNGIYSIYDNRWIKTPKKLEDIPDVDVEVELKTWQQEIDNAISKNSLEDVQKLLNLLYLYRKNSLDTEGEFGKYNVLFKELRNNGYLDKLKEKKNQLISSKLSLESLDEYLNLGNLINSLTLS